MSYKYFTITITNVKFLCVDIDALKFNLIKLQISKNNLNIKKKFTTFLGCLSFT